MPVLCIRCGSEKAVVHFTQIVNDVTRRFDLCATCAGPMIAEVKESWSASGPASHFPGGAVEEMWPGLTPEEHKALSFISACISKAHSSARRIGPHVSAGEILDVASGVARDMFGDSAQEELRKIGIVSLETLGELIFRFIEKGIFSKTAKDSIDEFRSNSSFDDFIKPA